MTKDIVGTYRTTRLNNTLSIRVTLISDILENMLTIHVSVIINDGNEVLLDVDWDSLRRSVVPVIIWVGAGAVSLDAAAIDAIDTMGWRLLNEHGHFPTEWVERY